VGEGHTRNQNCRKKSRPGGKAIHARGGFPSKTAKKRGGAKPEIEQWGRLSFQETGQGGRGLLTQREGDNGPRLRSGHASWNRNRREKVGRKSGRSKGGGGNLGKEFGSGTEGDSRLVGHKPRENDVMKAEGEVKGPGRQGKSLLEGPGEGINRTGGGGGSGDYTRGPHLQRGPPTNQTRDTQPEPFQERVGRAYERVLKSVRRKL